MLLSPLTSTASGNFIQDRVASTERPKPPLVSLQKVEGTVKRERWAILGLGNVGPLPPLCGLEGRLWSQLGRWERFQSKMKSSLSIRRRPESVVQPLLAVFSGTLTEAEKLPILGSINKKWTQDQFEWSGVGRQQDPHLPEQWWQDTRTHLNLSATYTTSHLPSLKQVQPPDISHRGTCLKFSD